MGLIICTGAYQDTLRASFTSSAKWTCLQMGAAYRSTMCSLIKVHYSILWRY